MTTSTSHSTFRRWRRGSAFKQKEIARLPYVLFKPEYPWELKGEVNNVCFPTGTVVIGDTLYIYYGAADERIACATISVSALLTELLLNTSKNEK